MAERTCEVPGCDKPPRSGSAALCKMHYHRQYRHGSVERTARKERHGRPRSYRLVSRPGHALAGPSGRVYEHRAVLYDALGPGPHACHWCGVEVDWLPRGTPGELQPDHLNGAGDDNRIENLVPSCRACNVTRGLQDRGVALRQLGWWSVNDTIAQGRSQTRRPPVTAQAS